MRCKWVTDKKWLNWGNVGKSTIERWVIEDTGGKIRLSDVEERCNELREDGRWIEEGKSTELISRCLRLRVDKFLSSLLFISASLYTFILVIGSIPIPILTKHPGIVDDLSTCNNKDDLSTCNNKNK